MAKPKKFHEEIQICKQRAYKVVADIGQYPEFVPWCLSTERVENPNNSSNENQSTEEKSIVEYWRMEAGFKYIRDSYISKVTLVPHSQITAEALDARLFNHMKTVWRFEDLPEATNNDGNTIETSEDSCLLIIDVDFEFQSYLYAWIANLFFIQVTTSMVKAFLRRLNSLQE